MGKLSPSSCFSSLLFSLALLLGAEVVLAQQITGVTPNKAKTGQTLDVVISGDLTHFGQGTTVLETSLWFSQATATASPIVIFPNTVTVQSATEMTANFTLNLGYPWGDYHVSTINGVDGTIMLPNGFNINNNPVGIEHFKKQYRMDIFPNPVKDVLTVRLDLPEAANVAYKLTNVQGKNIFHKQVPNAAAGRQQQTFDLKANGLSAGTYFLQVRVNNEVVTQSVVLK